MLQMDMQRTLCHDGDRLSQIKPSFNISVKGDLVGNGNHLCQTISKVLLV